MVPDESSKVRESGGSSDDPVRSAWSKVADDRSRLLALVAVVLLVVFYGVFIQQRLLVVIWLLVSGFLVYLLWRFVRAHERIAGAAERVAERQE